MAASSRPSWAITALLTLLLVTLACGTSGDDASVSAGAAGASSIFNEAPQIFDNGRILTLEDLAAIGFKKSKTFDVEGLPSATDAYYGFWGLDPYDRKEFEARFYPTHEDAVAFGTAPADERTGRDAILKADQATWDGGLKEARACTRSSGQDSSNCKASRYGNFAIFGNLILVCQGRDEGSGNETCSALLAELHPG